MDKDFSELVFRGDGPFRMIQYSHSARPPTRAKACSSSDRCSYKRWWRESQERKEALRSNMQMKQEAIHLCYAIHLPE